MPYEITKQERYANFGGINTKASRYLTGAQQVIRLVNYDFSRPGAFTKRPDTTEFLDLDVGPIKTIYEFTQTTGASYLIIQGGSGVFSVTSNGTTQLANGPIVPSGITYPMDPVTFQNNVLMAGVQLGATTTESWYRYFGASLVAVQMIDPTFGFGSLNGVSAFNGSSPVYFATLNGWRWSAAYVNERNTESCNTSIFGGGRLWGLGITSIALELPIANMYSLGRQFSASYALVYREEIGYTAALLNLPATAVTTAIFKIPLSSGVSLLIDTGATTCTFLMGATMAPYTPNTYYPFGDLGSAGTTGQLISQYFNTKDTGMPTIISVYNNMPFYSGFPKYPSHVFWGELGYFEWVDNENFNEIRTTDGEKVTCLVPYDGNLIATKRTSIHVINGDDPDTISFSEKTDQYGFINNRAACVFQDVLWGIDGQGKGIVEFNGANVDIVSDEVEDIFFRINLNAAASEAFMLHVKSRNEVWCGIPVDGASLVNTIIVYDYYSKAWTTYEGLSPTAVAIARGTLSLPAVVMGFSNGGIRSLNSVFSGVETITAVVRAPFISNYGWSATETYRRLFVDTDPILGATYSFLMNLYLDQGSTPSYTATFLVQSQQSRAEFGLPGKGMSVELIEASDHPLRVNGYTVGSRFQRNV